MPAIWLVEEDKPGRWRQFPEDLSDLVEGRWQLWQASDQEPHYVVEYQWTVRGQVHEYELTFDRPYTQAKRVKFNSWVPVTLLQVQRAGGCGGG